MSELAALAGIVIAIGVGAASPGPSFLVVARTAASQGRRSGLHVAIGMGIGSLVFAAAALLGLNALFSAIPLLYVVLKMFGGIYLLYLGFCIWRGSTRELSEGKAEGQYHNRRYFALGLTTQVSNPKTAIVYAGVFAAFMPHQPTLQFNLAVLVSVFCIEAGWYAAVATALSAPKWRQRYVSYKKWLDRSAGSVMGLLGVKLASSAEVL